MHRIAVCRIALLPFALPLAACDRDDESDAPSYSLTKSARRTLSFAVQVRRFLREFSRTVRQLKLPNALLA